MAYATQGRRSVTLPNGITIPAKAAPLNALLVVCHGWGKRSLDACRRSPAVPGRWVSPLFRWTRPVRRVG
jgi:hypothetical protein